MVKTVKGWNQSARAKNLSFLCRKLEREKIFYREQLEIIANDKRRTSGQRLAKSALTFWDAIQAEAKKKEL